VIFLSPSQTLVPSFNTSLPLRFGFRLHTPSLHPPSLRSNRSERQRQARTRRCSFAFPRSRYYSPATFPPSRLTRVSFVPLTFAIPVFWFFSDAINCHPSFPFPCLWIDVSLASYFPPPFGRVTSTIDEPYSVPTLVR